MSDYTPQGTARYGAYYWCIKTKLSKSGEIYVMADEAVVRDNGALVMLGKNGTNLAIASGQWTACYAASLLDGSAVAVEHWDGEVKREGHYPLDVRRRIEAISAACAAFSHFGGNASELRFGAMPPSPTIGSGWSDIQSWPSHSGLSGISMPGFPGESR